MSAQAPRRAWQLPLHWITAVGSSLLLVTTVALLGWAAYRGSQSALLSVTDDAVSFVSGNLEQRLLRVLQPAENQLRLLAYSRLATARNPTERLEALPELAEALEGNPLIDALYAGYPNGEFILFRPLRNNIVRKRFEAPSNAVTLVQTISLAGDEGMRGEYRYYDALQRLLEVRVRPDYRYDPRTRPWFREAMAQDGMVLTEPYVFFTTQVVGATLTRRSFNRAAVIGMDATLESLVSQLGRLRVTPSTEIALIDVHKRVLAYSDASRVVVHTQGGKVRLAQIEELGVPILNRAADVPPAGGGSKSVEAAGRGWRVLSRRMGGSDRYPLNVIMAIPEDELFAHARQILRSQALIALAVLVLSMPLGWWLTQRLTRPLQRLVEDAKAVEAFDFAPRPQVRSHIAEVDRLGRATQRMSATIASFLDTSIALGSERRIERLIDTVLRNALDVVAAKAGAVYLVEGSALVRAHAQTHAADVPVDFAERYDWDEDLDATAVQAWREQDLFSSGNEVATALQTRDGALVGVMLIVLDPARPLVRAGAQIDPRAGFIRALSAQAAVAIETRRLIEQQKALLESFIRLIAAAIDAKSHYTGGHCQRVPELAKLLANAAHESESGQFAPFRLSEEDREALHIGAWLHDCGKVTTPEHVVDKATKLEAICDRIHEVRMRFEVLKRDAEIASLRARLAGADASQVEATLVQAWRELDEEFAFVAECNLGGETMDPARIERLKSIAARTWQRTLDDRLGISWEAAQRCKATPAAALPATENLLADKPEHRIERPANERFDADNKWGFRMEVPEFKANLGELYNLSTLRGTLTAEDRYIINHHIVQTIVMLDTLPFPRELANVPEIAGGHHERMDGKGYPKRLIGEEMSVLARVMAIADVFEALTASDRPYKRPNTLSQAVRIMAQMAGGQHLDRDLFRLFLESGTHRTYAERFLAAEQCDEVDVPAALAAAGC